MALFLTGDDVLQCMNNADVISVLEQSLRKEAAGLVSMPSRHNINCDSGWLRIMPAVVGGDGAAYMGMKVMNLIRGQGTQYMILLYDSATGELVSIMDAAAVTQRRTAGTTALAAKYMVNGEYDTLGLFGSGFEARGHLELLAEVLPLKQAFVYSPRPHRREQFAAEMSAELGINVIAAESPDQVAGLDVVCLATKATEPVISGDWLKPGATVLSIGSTRLDLRELDRRSLERAATLVVDHKEQVIAESGDIADALQSGVLADEQIVSLTDIVVGKATVRTADDDIAVLKTVGTALQDIAVAGLVYETAKAKGLGHDLGYFPALKAFV